MAHCTTLTFAGGWSVIHDDAQAARIDFAVLDKLKGLHVLEAGDLGETDVRVSGAGGSLYLEIYGALSAAQSADLVVLAMSAFTLGRLC